ncbi:alpha/beta hydrolase [Marinobacterium lutimaris]|uniref:Esterase n=1 Tax=Marinobacterium lutimaris TaxID=568106 RepID=A0A1H5W6D0_9GAMM|nr:alpha/beta hydrolase-fold protein [Marinobacterium lutimaris]SEF94357.1 hypothetical protein SAMN05444390_101937 [Marinobacterium lutimaris]
MRFNRILRQGCSALLLCLASTTGVYAEPETTPTANPNGTLAATLGIERTIHSQRLDQEQSYSVFLPKHYDPAKAYPVLYLFDGQEHYLKTLGVIEGLTDGIWPSMPDLILVGLDNRDRMRNYTPTHTLLLPNGENGSPAYARTGGGTAFLDFIDKELRPRIQQDYSTSHLSILAGHSFGGLMTLEAYRDKRDFNAFVAIDPSLWFDYPDYYRQLEADLKTGDDEGTKRGALFIAASDNPFTPGLGMSSLHRDLIQALGESLSAGDADRVLSTFYPATDHSSVVLPALEQSLAWLFYGYRIGLTANGPNSPEVINGYRVLSHRLGAEIKPERPDLQFQWAYLSQRLPASDQTPLFKELLEHYYPDQPIEPRGKMAH